MADSGRARRQPLGIRNILFVFTMFISGSLFLSLYMLTAGCCAGVADPDGSGTIQRPIRVVLVQDGDEDEARYQRVLDQSPGYMHFRRKPLLDIGDSSPDQQQQQHQQANPDISDRRTRNSKDNAHDTAAVIKYNDYDDYDDDDVDAMAVGESSASIVGVSRMYDVDVGVSQLNRRERTRKSNKGRGRAVRRLPQAIIIGVKKGGTRALLEYLRIHPDVRAPGPEPHFFDRNYDKGLEWYRRQMPPTYDSQLTMEKTPSYFVTKGVPARIFNMSKDTRFIVVVRDPVTRAVSDYTQALAKRNDVDTFEGMAFEDNSTGLVDTSWGAIRIGVYAKHLERWLQYFPLSQMHFVSGERLITDPAGEMAKVQDFLGIERAITEKNFVFNSTKGFPCLLRTPGGSARKPHCLGKTKGREHPRIEPKVLTRLRDFFRPFNQKFYQMVGQDFGWS